MLYDGIILGAGHNGLILQAYLGKAGLKVVAALPRGHPYRTRTSACLPLDVASPMGDGLQNRFNTS